MNWFAKDSGLSEEQLREKLKKYETEYKALQKELQKEKNDKEKLMKELETKQQVISSSKDLNQISFLHNEVDELKASNQSLLTSLHSLQDMMRQQGTSSGSEELRVLQKENENLAAEVARLEEELHGGKPVVVDTHEEELYELRKFRREFDSTLKRQEEVVRQKDEQIARLSSQMKESSSGGIFGFGKSQQSAPAAAATTTTDQRIFDVLLDQLTNTFAQMEDNEEKHKKEIAEMTKKIEKLQGKFNNASLDIEKKTHAYEELSQEYQTILNELSLKKNEINSHSQLFDREKMLVTQLQNELESRKILLTDSREHITALESQIEREIQEKDAMRKEKEILLLELVELKNTIKSLEDSVNNVKIDNVMRNKKYIYKIRDLNEINKLLFTKIMKLNDQLNSKGISRGDNKSSPNSGPGHKRIQSNRDLSTIDSMNKLAKENAELKQRIESLQIEYNTLSQKKIVNGQLISEDVSEYEAKIKELSDKVDELKKNLKRETRRVEKYKLKESINKYGEDHKDVVKKFNRQLKEQQNLRDRYEELFGRANNIKDICNYLLQQYNVVSHELSSYTKSTKESINITEQDISLNDYQL